MYDDIYSITGLLYRVITNDVSDYINLLVRFAHIICNHTLHWTAVSFSGTW